MDIIFHLSFPIEICNKIFIFACKSPHNGLGIQTLKHFAYIDNTDKSLPSQDRFFFHFNSSKYSFINYLKPLDLFKIGRFENLNKLTISPCNIGDSSNVVGDIQVLRFMPKLVEIYIKDSFIYGDICNLENLHHLKYLYLLRTHITGNIKYISKLNKLLIINMNNTNIYGDIRSIKSNKSLICAHLHKTNVKTYYYQEFNKYRIKYNLPGCSVII